MLQNIRDRLTGRMAIIVLALMSVPFLFFGLSSPLISGQNAATVNGEDIPLAVFDNAYRQQLANYGDFGNELPEQLRGILKQNVLNNLIWDTVVDQHVAEAGYRISDEMIARFIQEAPEFQVDGVFSKEAYYQWMAERGIEPTSFEANQRINLREGQLQRGVAATAFVTPAEYRRYLNLVREEREVAVATFDIESIAETIEVSDEDVQSYYDDRPDDFRSPETVEFKYVELNRDTLAQQVELSEEEIQAYYEASSNRYQQDEQRSARHILIPFGDDEAAAEQQATALTARIRAGEPFADLARQHSADTISAQQGGDLGYQTKAQLLEGLSDAVFSMRSGEVNGPVRSDFGFHVVRLDDIRAGGPLPLEQVRAELERELREDKAEDNWRDKEDALSDALFDAEDIDAVAASAGLEVQNAVGFTRTGGTPFGNNQALIDAVFDDDVLQQGRITDLIEIDASRSVAVQVEQYNEASRLPLAEVRDSIIGAIKTDRARAIITEKSNLLQVALRDGEAFDVAAEAAGASATSTAVIRRDNAEIDPNVRAAVFEVRKPQPDQPRIGSVQTQSGDQAVFAVTRYAPGRPEAIPVAQRDEAKRQLAAQGGQADYTAFVFELERQADVSRNQDALEQQSLFE